MGIEQRHLIFWHINDDPEVCKSGDEVDARVLDEGQDPHVVVVAYRETGSVKWESYCYVPDLRQLQRDEAAEQRQRTPHYG